MASLPQGPNARLCRLSSAHVCCSFLSESSPGLLGPLNPTSGLEASNELDEHLDALACRETRPRIIRVKPPADGRSLALQAMGVGAPPALVVFRRGRVAGIAAGYTTFGSADSIEARCGTLTQPEHTDLRTSCASHSCGHV